MGDMLSTMNQHFTNCPKGSQKIITHYNMTHKCIGRALIFNHEVFIDPENSPRTGTDKDCHRMKTTLERLGFNVTVCQDYDCDAIETKVVEVANENHQNNDCFVLVLMTHGELGSVEAHDKCYPVKKLWEPFTSARCPSLADKPKLFFIQACQGSLLDHGFTLDGPSGELNGSRDPVPTLTTTDVMPFNSSQDLTLPVEFFEPDFLICYSTAPGYYSWRTPSTGSWFIQTLCDELQRNGYKMDLLALLTHVNQEVALNFESITLNKESDGKKQTLCIKSTLVKLVRFNLKKTDLF